MTNEGLEAIAEDECYARLRTADLGRVGVRHGEIILVLPVYFALDGRNVVFRTDPGAKLDAAVLNSRVAFEVDDERDAWSVLVVGHAEELRDGEECARVRELLAGCPRVGRREHLVRINTERVTGRRVVRHAALDDDHSAPSTENTAAQSER
jgi:hypothetical protein